MDPDPELYKFVAGSGFKINHSGSTTLFYVLYDADIFHSFSLGSLLRISVAEPPLFWAAPAPGRQGPGADSGSDLLGSAPAPQIRLSISFPMLYSKLFNCKNSRRSGKKQCFGSGSARIRIKKCLLDPDPDPGGEKA